MIKGSIQEEDMTIVNIYAPNMEAAQCIRQTLTDIKGEIDCDTIAAGDFRTPLAAADRSSKQKVAKETQVLSEPLDEMGLIDVFRTFHQMQKNSPSSQVHMEQSPGQTTSWVTNQTSVNLRNLRSYQASSLTML